MIHSIDEMLAHLIMAAVMFMLFVASTTAILFERKAKNAICWAALIWLVPVLGAACYLLYKTWTNFSLSQRQHFYKSVLKTSRIGTFNSLRQFKNPKILISTNITTKISATIPHPG